jgi:hypothetical protein
MNPPNQKKATIGEMVTWASQANGKIKRGAKYHLINAILMDIENLQASRPPEEPRFHVSRIRQLCGLLGLGFNKINGRIVITRKTYTEKPKTKCQADL